MRFLIFALSLVLPTLVRAQPAQHYVYFELARERIREPTFLATRQLVGAQLKYTWDESVKQFSQGIGNR